MLQADNNSSPATAPNQLEAEARPSTSKVEKAEEDGKKAAAATEEDDRRQQLQQPTLTEEREGRGSRLLGFLRDTLWETMRDACVVFVFALMVTQIFQEAGHPSKKRFVMGVAENVPEAAVPRGLSTRAYSARSGGLVGLFNDVVD